MAAPAIKLLMACAGASTGTPTLPITANLFAWYDASNAGSITESSGRVDQIDDLSGNGHHLSSTGSNRPFTGSRTMNGRNVLDFQGGQHLRYDSATLPGFTDTTFSFLMVTGTDVITSWQGFLIIPPPGTGGGDHDYEDGVAFEAGDNTNLASLYIHNGGVHISGSGATPIGTWVGRKGTGTSQHDLMSPGGGSASATNTANFSGFSGIFLGRRYISGALTSDFLDGPIAELAIWTSRLSDADRTSVRNYAIAKWGA